MTFRVREGKFYDGDKIVPLEFGNKAQIDMLAWLKSIKEHGRVYFEPRFKCCCGAIHEKKFTHNKTFKCDCGAKYRFFVYDDDIPVIQMI